MTRLVFTGHIAGFGTRAGVRMVVGSWLESPFGHFADVMVETADGQRTLLAPSEQVAEFVSATYTFDRREIGPVAVHHTADGFTVTAPGLEVTGELGGPAPFDWLLRMVPAPLSRAPWWLRGINPVASRLVSGVQTAGSAGNGRREYYGVRRTRRITCRAGQVRRCGSRRGRRSRSSGAVRLLVGAADAAAGVGDDDDRPAARGVCGLADVAGGGATRRPAGEHAPAEEGPLQRAVAVHPAAAESGRLTGGVQPGQHGRRRPRSTRESRSVSKPPNDFRVRMCSFTAISGPAFGSVSRCGATTRLTRSARYLRARADRGDLAVLGEPVDDLPVPRGDLCLDDGEVQRLDVGHGVHRRDQVPQRVRR